MKDLKKWILVFTFGLGSFFNIEAAETKFAVVNFKKCVEDSKLGKHEQEAFEAMRKKMEGVVAEKEKALSELAEKLNNADELELMSPEAETELKRKFRAQSQEMNQIQTQFYQTLSQANVQIVQSLAEVVAKAAEKVAKEKKIDVILNDESCFYCTKDLDISSDVVQKMNDEFSEEKLKKTE